MNLSEDLLSLGGNQLPFLCSCSLIFAARWVAQSLCRLSKGR